jgi:hypothetical protein
MAKKKKKTPSKTSPKDSNRGCLCKDGTYNKECCDGSLQAQGIGSTQEQGTSVTTSNRNVRVKSVNRG